MAIIGTFEADFSQFTSAVRGAETQLRSLEGNSQKVVSSIDRVGSSLVGIAGAFGVAFTTTAVVNFGRELLRAADELTKLHDRTGLSIRALQQFKVVGDDAGNTVNEIAAAVTQMQNGIAGGDRSAVGALNALGLSLNEIRKLSPEQQFIAISDALRQVEDPAQQVNIAMDLFGRAGANILPTLKAGFDDVRDGAVGMSAESVRALEAFGEALERASNKLVNLVGEGTGRFLLQITDSLGETRRATDGAREAAERARPAFDAVLPPGLPEDLKEIEDGFKRDEAAINKAAAAAEKAAVKLRELQAATRDRTLELLPLKGTDVQLPEFAPTGAFQQILAENTAIREQAEALALVEQQMTENFLIVGQTGEAHTVAGAAAVSAADQVVQSYAAAASAIGGTAQQAERFIVSQQQLMELGEAQRLFNRRTGATGGLASASQEALLRGFEIVTARGGAPGGGGTTIVNNIDASNSFYDTPEGVQRLATKVGEALIAQRRSLGGTA